MKSKSILLLLTAVFSFYTTTAQKTDNTQKPGHFAGAISVTNNGISFIPSFSLGKPAAIFNLSMGKGKLSFDPELRFALEGKPWSFLFWWRYQLVKTNKFGLRLGAHPALNFRTQTVALNGVTKDVIITRRYLAGELTPNYYINKNISIGMYYLYSRGIDKDAVRNTHFLTINSNFSNIKLSSNYYMKFAPQVFYLKQDKQDGFFVTVAVTLARKNFPLSLSSIVNKRIESNITGSKNFVWNATLVYSFNKQYVQK
ncbi:MAG: hypothetical protein IPP72_16420 [Chitinophagaceae bacterium]|nr:hypothetical protein [Chitinophagaceae bacterium]